MATYKSKHTGQTIDEGIDKAIGLNLENGTGTVSTKIKGSQATGSYSHAGGYNSKTGLNASQLLGFDLELNYILVDDVSNFAVGDLLCMYVVPTDSSKLSKNYDGFATVTSKDAEGNYLVATLPADLATTVSDGIDTTKSFIFVPSKDTGDVSIGTGAHTEGYENEAQNIGAHAEGASNKAIGKYAHAENNENIALGWNTHVEGFQNTGKGQKSHTEGYGNVNNGDTTHVEGRDNKNVAGSQSHVEGRDNTLTSDAQYTHVEGWQNTGSATAAHVEGNGNNAGANTAHAEGYHTVASGQSAHAEGRQTEATAYGAHAEGFGGWAGTSKVQATGSGSHAEGRADGANIVASGQGAHAEGRATGGKNLTASGIASHAEGEGTTASGEAAHAEGLDTIASGVASHASGEGTTAQGRAQTVVGKFNKPDSNSLFKVGCGTDAQNKADIFSCAKSTVNGEDAYVIMLGDRCAGPYTSAEIRFTMGFFALTVESISGYTLTFNFDGVHYTDSEQNKYYKSWANLLDPVT